MVSLQRIVGQSTTARYAYAITLVIVSSKFHSGLVGILLSGSNLECSVLHQEIAHGTTFCCGLLSSILCTVQACFRPFVMFNVDSGTQQDGGVSGGSWKNTEEVKLMMTMLNYMYDKFKPEDIGIVAIISPYRSQVCCEDFGSVYRVMTSSKYCRLKLHRNLLFHYPSSTRRGVGSAVLLAIKGMSGARVQCDSINIPYPEVLPQV